jgi:hypothetical protein
LAIDPPDIESFELLHPVAAAITSAAVPIQIQIFIRLLRLFEVGYGRGAEADRRIAKSTGEDVG